MGRICYIPASEAGRAVLLRRRGEEGRPGAGAGPRLADERARQGSGALLLSERRPGGLRGGTQQELRALPLRQSLPSR
jgi:hypothetical protein